MTELAAGDANPGALAERGDGGGAGGDTESHASESDCNAVVIDPDSVALKKRGDGGDDSGDSAYHALKSNCKAVVTDPDSVGLAERGDGRDAGDTGSRAADCNAMVADTSRVIWFIASRNRAML